MEVLSSRVILSPIDFDTSRRFYEETLGLRLYHEYGNGDHVVGVVYFAGGGYVELVASGANPPPTGAKLWLQVPDLEAVQERLDQLGVEIDDRAARKPWGLIELHLRDPDGVVITLVEVPEDHFLRKSL